MARKAVDLGGKNPNLPYFHLALGMAEYRNGHFAEAGSRAFCARGGARSAMFQSFLVLLATHDE